MLKYIGKRLIMLIPVILVTSFLIFWAMSLTGGDPALMLAGDNAKPEQIEQIREDLGLNDPFIVRYGNYMKGMLTGDMGKSYVTSGMYLRPSWSVFRIPCCWAEPPCSSL